jgi:hypothetical protein
MAAEPDDHEPALGFDLTNMPKPEIHMVGLRVLVVVVIASVFFWFAVLFVLPHS